MFTSLLVLIFTGLFVYASYKYAVQRPEGFPPGPPKIPLFGSYLFLRIADSRFSHKALLKFCQWYKSDIIGMHMGSNPIITVHSAESIREVLNNSVFDGRAVFYTGQMRDPEGKIAGIFFNEGPVWKEQRRFILRYLRDYGFGRRYQQLELIMQEQLSDMLDLIRSGPKYDHEKSYVKEGGYRILLPYFFNPFSANSLFHIMYNETRPRSEQAELWELVRMGMQFQRCNDDYGKMLSIQPWVRHVFPNWSQYNPIHEANQFMRQFFEKMVDRHMRTHDESCDRNFIDMYIREMKQAEAEGNANTSFKKNQFLLSLVDFTLPAITAVGVQISFLVQYFLLHPEVQRKIQKEIDDVVGSGRLATLEDRKSLHYTEATLREILRIESVVPSNVNHKALEDTTLCGYNVPKNTTIMTSLYAFHRDKNVWGDPENFRPERYLDDEGKLCLKKDVSLPFGAGKRLCAGETFARNMMFLLICALCQNFNFVLAPQDKLPDLSTNLGGVIISPKDFWVQLEERK